MRKRRFDGVQSSMTQHATMLHRRPRPPRARCNIAVDCLGVTIIDLDRTLTRRGTYSPFLIYAAGRSAPWRLVLIPAVLACMAGYRLGWMSRKRLKQRMHRMLLGPAIPRARVERLASAFAARVMRSNLNPGARDLVAREQAEGRLVVLATAAHRFYAEAVAHRLGIDRVVASESVWRGDQLTPELRGANCYGADKAVAVRRYLDGMGLDRSAVSLRCYSDDISDLPCFEACDEAIAVNPSAALERMSGARGWPVLRLR
jgi:HAD superfamily hydrolase (TIGR01490 family)